MYPNQPQSPPPQQPPQYPPQAQGYAPQAQAYPQTQYAPPQQPPQQQPPQQFQPFGPAQAQAPQPPLQPVGAPSTPPGDQSGIDYLNQIAPKTSPSGFSLKNLWLFIVLGAMVLFAGILMLITSSSPSTRENVSEMALHTSALSEVVSEAQPNIQDGRLAAINSTLRIYLTNASTELGGGERTRVDDNNNPLKELSEKIEDARLSGTFDRTYARELSFQLEALLIMLNRVAMRANNPDQKAMLEKLHTDLTPIEKTFSEITAEIG